VATATEAATEEDILTIDAMEGIRAAATRVNMEVVMDQDQKVATQVDMKGVTEDSLEDRLEVVMEERTIIDHRLSNHTINIRRLSSHGQTDIPLRHFPLHRG
jgi:hypothetical protein